MTAHLHARFECDKTLLFESKYVIKLLTSLLLFIDIGLKNQLYLFLYTQCDHYVLYKKRNSQVKKTRDLSASPSPFIYIYVKWVQRHRKATLKSQSRLFFSILQPRLSFDGKTSTGDKEKRDVKDNNDPSGVFFPFEVSIRAQTLSRC